MSSLTTYNMYTEMIIYTNQKFFKCIYIIQFAFVTAFTGFPETAKTIR